MPKKKSPKRSPKKSSAAAAPTSFGPGQRIKVAAKGNWANGYLGACVGETDAGNVVVQLDVKGVTHEFKREQLVAI